MPELFDFLVSYGNAWRTSPNEDIEKALRIYESAAKLDSVPEQEAKLWKVQADALRLRGTADDLRRADRLLERFVSGPERALACRDPDVQGAGCPRASRSRRRRSGERGRLVRDGRGEGTPWLRGPGWGCWLPASAALGMGETATQRPNAEASSRRTQGRLPVPRRSHRCPGTSRYGPGDGAHRRGDESPRRRCLPEGPNAADGRRRTRRGPPRSPRPARTFGEGGGNGADGARLARWAPRPRRGGPRLVGGLRG